MDKRVDTSAHYGNQRSFSLLDSRLGNLSTDQVSSFDQSIADVHGVDFITDVIPHTIQRVRQEHPHRKVRILDTGAGLGLFADQVRHVFGDDVVMFGTGLGRAESVQRKRDLLDRLRRPDKLTGLTPEEKQFILEFAQDNIHPNDTKWTGLLDLHNFEEFDLIIDTFGEFHYAKNEGDFGRLLGVALLKLRPGGQLYIANASPWLRRVIEEHSKQIKKSYHVDIEETATGAVFTKLTTDSVSQTDDKEG